MILIIVFLNGNAVEQQEVNQESAKKINYNKKEIEKILNNITNNKIKAIDKVPEKDRTILRHLLNSYFANIRGYSFVPIKEENRKYFDKYLIKVCRITSTLFLKKTTELLIDFYGKPTDVRLKKPNQIEIVYRVAINGAYIFVVKEGMVVLIKLESHYIPRGMPK